MISDAQFRLDFPEFANTTTFPASAVAYWIALARQLMSTGRWGSSAADPWPSSGTIPDRTLYDLGVSLFVAHNLVLEAITQRTVTGGGLPGGISGAVQSKSVDKVSISYDVTAGLTPGAGHWNLTIYGMRLLHLINMIGAGPVQL